ncbi:MAG: pyridoxamine 5'-phosphate oxidase family protein [Sphaerochaetaceae bacterium]|nr:pyridoxamine 5'-phosphate oxidase family protein [Sphaerochaetaceae bacterium]
MRNPEQTIGDMIDKQSVAFVASVDGDGYPNLKAMLAPRRREGVKVFYFTTNVSSMRVSQYRENSKAAIYFYSKRFRYQGVMLKGAMEVLDDDETKRMIWQNSDTMYYPGGVADPDYCVLRFTAKEGRYYTNFKTETFSIGSITA